MLDFDEDGFMRVPPVGPWVVMEDDEDDTYELFDLGITKHYVGIPCCNVWVYCATKLRVKKTYHGKMSDIGHNSLPTFIPDKS